MRKALCMVVLMIGMASLSEARQDTGCEFLTFGVGARAAGIGEAFVGVSADPISMYWNPAGIGFVKQPELFGVHSNLYQNISNGLTHDFAGCVYPLKTGCVYPLKNCVLGIGVNYLNSGKHSITEYNAITQEIETTGSFNSRDMAVMASFVQANENLAVGVNLKYISSDVYYIHAKACAADVGVMYKTAIDGLTVGGVLENVGTKIYFVDKPQSDVLPAHLKAGVSYQRGDVLYVADVNKHIYGNFVGINLGCESVLTEHLIGRLGYLNKGAGLKGVTYGAGVKYSNWQIDFANVPAGDLGRSSKISMSKGF